MYKIHTLIAVLLVIILAGWAILHKHTASAAPSNTSSSSSQAVPDTLLAGAPPTGNVVSCSLTSTLITNADGSQQAKVSWNISQGTSIFTSFPEANGSSTQTGSVTSAVLTKAQTFSASVANGNATSSCSTSATPTSFATP